MSHRVVSRCKALGSLAADRGVPAAIIERAGAATVRRLGSIRSASFRRIDAYYWAVVRRSSVRDRSAGAFAERLVLDAVIDDLRTTGMDNARIRDELERGWRGVVDDAALEAVSSRLCA
ncbi:MAG: hypothetical protein HY876_06235 [Coriobacteriales bacterium]|nr:hypothetical protein [Coriobacteriales bacterium]